jgi:hypothetical protein
VAPLFINRTPFLRDMQAKKTESTRTVALGSPWC